jgi:hypothetical protein
VYTNERDTRSHDSTKRRNQMRAVEAFREALAEGTPEERRRRISQLHLAPADLRKAVSRTPYTPPATEGEFPFAEPIVEDI